jgi:flavodoxin
VSLKAILLIACLVAAALAASIILVLIKDRTYFHSPPYTKEKTGSTDVLVVYYSRSGNTEAMAREIARKFEADIVRIEADKYTLDFEGWRHANRDAEEKLYAEIEPEVIDMDRYHLVFLGSPIWWFRPAPPLWTFVEKNNFTDKDVVLFNTFNSRFKAGEIQEFGQKIEEKGGRLVDHVYVRRGRVYHQMNGEQLMEDSQEIVDDNMKKWLESK